MLDRSVLVCILCVILFQPLQGQQSKTLASVGKKEITNEEFIQRFEFAPHPNQYLDDGGKEAKLNFLKTLIAEKLLASKAETDGMDKSPEFIRVYNFTRNRYLRDALYNSEIKNKVSAADSQIAAANNKLGKTLTVKFIFSNDEKEIEQIFGELNAGASFDSILALRPEFAEQNDTTKISFGKMNEKIENYIYDLHPGMYTPPVELREGWYICKVYSQEKNPITPDDLEKAAKVIKQRNEDKTYEAFYKKFFKGVSVNTDRKLNLKLKTTLLNYIKENTGKFAFVQNKYTLFENEVGELKKNFSPAELSAVFVKFKQNPVTLAGFLEYLGLEGFDFNNTIPERIESRYNNFVSTYIQNELLAREAAKKGLDKLPEVAADLRTWRENYLSTLAMKKVYMNQSVSDDEAYEFFIKNNHEIPQPDEIKIAEILTNDLDVIKTVFDELDKGISFSSLAEKYTLRDSLKNKGGEFGYEPSDKKGILWETAAKMKVGEVYGPIMHSEGYSVIKLIDRKQKKKKMFETFDEARNSIKDILQTGKMYSSLDNITAELALGNNISINETLLNSIKVSPVNMMVFRRFGFGGQMNAVPYSPDFSEWYKTYENLKKKTAL